jgi:hypothetical protein
LKKINELFLLVRTQLIIISINVPTNSRPEPPSGVDIDDDQATSSLERLIYLSDTLKQHVETLHVVAAGMREARV